MPETVDRGSRVAVAMALLGVVLGLICFTASVQGAPVVEYRILAAAGMPPPDEITAYVTAVCGAIVTVVNTLLLVWQKLNERPKRRKRKARPEHADDEPEK